MEMKVRIDAPVVVYEDNQSAIAIAKNEGDQNRAKHVDNRHHFARDQVKVRVIQLEYFKTKSLLADFLAK